MRATKTRLMFNYQLSSLKKSTHKKFPPPLKQKNPIELSYSIKKNMKTNHTIIRDCDVNS